MLLINFSAVLTFEQSIDIALHEKRNLKQPQEELINKNISEIISGRKVFPVQSAMHVNLLTCKSGHIYHLVQILF